MFADDQHFELLQPVLDAAIDAVGGPGVVSNTSHGGAGFVIFLDPPWGGLAYKDKASCELELSGVSLPDLMRQHLALRAQHGDPTPRLVDKCSAPCREVRNNAQTQLE